jgi:hypothetical protein
MRLYRGRKNFKEFEIPEGNHVCEVCVSGSTARLKRAIKLLSD